MILKEELPRSLGAQYATGDQWRNNSRKNEGMEPKQKQYPAVDVTGDRKYHQNQDNQYLYIYPLPVTVTSSSSSWDAFCQYRKVFTFQNFIQVKPYSMNSLCLASFLNIFFGGDSFMMICISQFIPFYCCVVVHCMDIASSVYLLSVD